MNWEVQCGHFQVHFDASCAKRRSELERLTFYKGEEDVLMFVVSESDLLAHSLGMALQSSFVSKRIARNTVHAVSTTNAVVEGLTAFTFVLL